MEFGTVHTTLPHHTEHSLFVLILVTYDIEAISAEVLISSGFVNIFKGQGVHPHLLAGLGHSFFSLGNGLLADIVPLGQEG